MSIRFLADADLRFQIVTGTRLREPSMDFLSAGEAQLAGMHDTEVLHLAATHGRILVSHDTKTMPGHFQSFLTMGNASPGVLIAAQTELDRDVIDALVLIWAASSPEDWTNRVHRIPSLAPYRFK